MTTSHLQPEEPNSNIQAASHSLSTKVLGFYESLGDLLNADLPPSEEIIKGGRRGQLSMLVSVTNLGKTTLMMNVAVMAAAGEAFLPLPKPPKPVKIMILDMEATGKELQADLRTMIENVPNRASVLQNIIPIVDAEIDDEILDLSNQNHYKLVCQKAKALQVDLIIVDTCSAAFDVEDENSNAEVRRAILLPLKRLAREANCHVLFIHHIGKASEDPARRSDPAYFGRGASAFGALSRAVFTLTPDKTIGVGHAILSCAKIKGSRFSDALLSLDPQTRWFRVLDADPQVKAEPPTMDEVVDFIKAAGEVPTGTIYSHFAERATDRTIDDRLSQARARGLIDKANKQAPWRYTGSKENPQTEALIGNTDCGLIN